MIWIIIKGQTQKKSKRKTAAQWETGGFSLGVAPCATCVAWMTSKSRSASPSFAPEAPTQDTTKR